MAPPQASESSRYAEAGRLITLARGILAEGGNSIAVTHLDLAFDLVLERQQAKGSAGSVAENPHAERCG